MAPTSSTDSEQHLTAVHRVELTRLAWASIEHGQLHSRPLSVQVEDFDPPLRQTRDAFVTLKKLGQLRGCIGSIVGRRPLVEDVAQNAYAAAFKDPRFPPLQEEELFVLDIHISVLSKPEPVHFDTEEDLLRMIRPGIDGLILAEGPRRGTFLPSVWETLPQPKEFLENLKLKAGLPKDYWSDSLTIKRYITESW